MAKTKFIGCSIKQLPDAEVIPAAARAVEVNPVNCPPPGALAGLIGTALAIDAAPSPAHLAVLTTKYWGAGGVKLTVGFLDNPPADLQARILAHMNAWGAYCNASFVLTRTDPQVRIAREADGYWSYLGTDILGIPKNQQTMNLEGFTMKTPESEFVRVVRHETGHTLGFPHEHMRRELVARIDRAKAIALFGRTQGWSASMVIQQVLTPIDERSIMGTEHADETSIMCYSLPGSITIDGRPIVGGNDFAPQDKAFAAKLYPLAVAPPPAAKEITLEIPAAVEPGKKYRLVQV